MERGFVPPKKIKKKGPGRTKARACGRPKKGKEKKNFLLLRIEKFK